MAHARHDSRRRRGIVDQAGASRAGRLPEPPEPCDQHRLLNERGVQVGRIDTTDSKPAFGPLEPTVLLHRDGADQADAPRGAHLEHTHPRLEGDREDGKP